MMMINDTKRPVLQSGDTIAVLNRGEAAVRFLRALREYNDLNRTEFRSVLFHVQADAMSPATRLADRLFCLDQSSRTTLSTRSPWQDQKLILEGLQATGCRAVWPGWGFLAENADFVRQLDKEGIVFIGPSAQAISLLGDKIKAKELAISQRVPILDWSGEPLRDLDHVSEVAARIGYPLIIKAANAGGGRGIRIVTAEKELASAYRSAADETERITGDRLVFIERCVMNARHLEVQLLADRHGHVRTFGVRDCTLQRRNQKVIEESPPVHLDPSIISTMERSAVSLAKAAGYDNAGTVEFIYDRDRGDVAFMEVNTRLQVEHPITEVRFGIDLVQQQLAIAMGESIEEMEVSPRGAVIEARLNAEDPDHDFAPSPGRIMAFSAPSGPGIRVDSGVESNFIIPREFDSMIAKIIAWGRNREEAIVRLRRALAETKIQIESGRSNRAFLLELLDAPEVRSGQVSTCYIEAFMQRRSALSEKPNWIFALIVAAIEQYLLDYRDHLDNFKMRLQGAGLPQMVAQTAAETLSINVLGNPCPVSVRAIGDNYFHGDVQGIPFVVRYLRSGGETILEYPDGRHLISVDRRGNTVLIEIDGIPYELDQETRGSVRSPAPAIVLSLKAKPGDCVQKGDMLLSLEAMKMEMIIAAPESGRVRAIHVNQGEQVTAGQILLELEEVADDDRNVCAGQPRSVFELFPRQTEAFLSIKYDELSMLKREFRGYFLGYDGERCHDILDRMHNLCLFDEKCSADYVENLSKTIEIFCSLEFLFTFEKMKHTGTARALDSQDYLKHYFLRSSNRGTGLPPEFLERLGKAISWYSWAHLEDDESVTRALFRMFRSHYRAEQLRSLLRIVLLNLEAMVASVSPELRQRLGIMLSQMAWLVQSKDAGLADLALHARYYMLDRPLLDTLTETRRLALNSIVDGLRNGSIDFNEENSDRMLVDVIDSGLDMFESIVSLIMKGTSTSNHATSLLLARFLTRDRDFVRTIEKVGMRSDKDNFAALETRSPRGSIELTIVTALDPKQGTNKDQELEGLNEISGECVSAELIVVAIPDRDMDGEFSKSESFEPSSAWSPHLVRCTVIFSEKDVINTRIFSRTSDGGWNEDSWLEGLNPLMLRELRFERFRDFDMSIRFRRGPAILYAARHRSVTTDERLFGLVSLADIQPVLDQEGRITRIIGFDRPFLDIVHAMRAEQAARPRRLYWNRIILHIRSPLRISLGQIRQYAMRLTEWTQGLGLEKVTIATRLKRRGHMQNIEFLLENISGSIFTLRHREPSHEPFLPVDSYAAGIIRARQRGALYPWQIIRMLTATTDNRLPYAGGEFEQYDVQRDETTGTWQSIRIAQTTRNGLGANGNGATNIIFGIIRHKQKQHDCEFARVLILADPTRDMCALGEAECLRINAAIDLADERCLPVEWVAVSAGARIEMSSGTENLDWTARTLRRIIEFTQNGGEINIIVPGINVGAQSYWNAEATMLMHTRGLLIMTDNGSMLLTGKKALDVSGSVSAEDNLAIGGAEKIMEPNGQAQVRVADIGKAYEILFNHYELTYVPPGSFFPPDRQSQDEPDRNVCNFPYRDTLGQGFENIGDILRREKNPERKRPFDMRQIMTSVVDHDHGCFERWMMMQDAETAIIWETRIGGRACGLIGIESQPLARLGIVPNDGPEFWSGGTLFPQSSRKVARALNAFSAKLPVVVLANLSGFDGSPESLREWQLEYGAEIGRAVVNFKGPLLFIVIARYHGGAYVVFSQALNPFLRAAALEFTYASVIGGAPAAAVVFPREVTRATYADERIANLLKTRGRSVQDRQRFDLLFQEVYRQKQHELAQKFDAIHSIERARSVGSITDIIKPDLLRPYIITTIDDLRRQWLSQHGPNPPMVTDK